MNENITDVNKIDLKNLSENEINQLPASVIIDNIRSWYDLQNLSNEDKIVECISFIQDPQNNFSNYNKDKTKMILSSIFDCCSNAKNIHIYEKLSAEQIIILKKMLQAAGFDNDIYDVFKDMTKHINNGSPLENKFLEIVDLINNDDSLPINFTVDFFSTFIYLKKLHEENKFNLDVNDIFNKISLEKLWEHNYMPGFFSLKESLNSELIDKFLNSCHDSEESSFALVDYLLFEKYIDKFGYEAGKNKLLKFVDKINNQENMPNEVVFRFFMNIDILYQKLLKTKNFELINEIYEKISIDKLFQYKNVINFHSIFVFSREEKINKILEVFHKNKENNDAFAKNNIFWDKYADKFGKEALKEKLLEIVNDINNGNISSDIANSFLSSLVYYYSKNPEFGIKEIIDKISVGKIVQHKIFQAIKYLDENKINELIDFCHDSKSFNLLFESQEILSDYINKFANEQGAIEDLSSYAKIHRFNDEMVSSIKNNLFNLPPDIVIKFFSLNEIENTILSNLDKINENNKSNIAPLLEKYVEKQNLSDKNKEITSAFIDSFKNFPPSSEQILPQLKNFFEFVDHPIQESQQEKQTIKPINKTKTKSIFSFKNKNQQEPKKEQQEK